MTRDPLRDLGRWLWYLLPANPILVRVVHSGGRRTRDLWYRIGYLAVLFAVFLLTFIGAPRGEALSEMAKASTQVFQFVATAQLLLMCFMAPVFTAGAITQEKDAETYNILLTTPLTNAQIILGSLVSRLFFVILLLFSGLPVFCITMMYGGVTLRHILLSAAIAGSTAVITGSLAILISMIKVGTRRTIFSFLLFIFLYLLAVYGLGRWSVTWIAEAPVSVVGQRQMSWLTAFHPFLALEVGLSRVPAPAMVDVARYGWPTKHLLASPQMSYCLMTCAASVVLVVISMLFVRRGALEGEPTRLNRLLGRLRRRGAVGEQRREPRRVWANPVAWREASTRASAGATPLLRLGIVAGGLLASIAILAALVMAVEVDRQGGGSGPFGPPQARFMLWALVAIEFALILVVATNASATSMTKERESNTLDIMMTTPLTSKQIVWGKLRGLISYTATLLALPVISIVVFVIYDLVGLASGREPVVHLETAVLLGAVLLVYTAVACVIGMQCSLKSRRTVQAVLVSVCIMTALCGLSYLIGDEIVEEAGEIGAVIAPLTPFTAVKLLIDPAQYGLSFSSGSTRALAVIGVAVAVVAWGAIVVLSMYNALVKNFYMTLRKQTAS